MGHITLEVLGVLFILLAYCVIGILFSEWEKGDKPWITIYNKILNRKLKKLCNKYPKNYQYDAVGDSYWYDSIDVSKCGHTIMESPEVKEFEDNWSMILYLNWPIFGIIEYIRKKWYEISNHFK